MFRIDKEMANLSCSKCGLTCTITKKCLKCSKFLCRKCYSGYCDCYPLNKSISFTTMKNSCGNWDDLLCLYKIHLSNCDNHQSILQDKQNGNSALQKKFLFLCNLFLLVSCVLISIYIPNEKVLFDETKIKKEINHNHNHNDKDRNSDQISHNKSHSPPVLGLTNLKFEINPRYAIGTYIIATNENKIKVSDHQHLNYRSFSSGQVNDLELLEHNLILSIGADHSLHLFNIATGKLIHSFKGHQDYISCITTIRDVNMIIISGSWDGSVKIWSLDKKKLVRNFEAHSLGVNSITYLDKGLMASGGMDNLIKIWNLKKGKVVHELKGHAGPISGLIYLKNDILASSSWDSRIRIWNIKTGECLYTLYGHSKMILTMIEIESEIIASGGEDNRIIIWNALMGKNLITLNGHKDKVTCLVYLANGWLASGSKDKTVRIWNVNYGIQIHHLEGHKAMIHTLIDLKDDLLASIGYDGLIHVWDIMSGQLIDVVEGYNLLKTQ